MTAAAPDPMGKPARRRPHAPRRCTARSKQTGEQCRRWATPGHAVCGYHGSKSPQAIAKAEQRLIKGAAAELTSRIDLRNAPSLEDPVDELARVAGQIVALKDRVVAQVAQADKPDAVLMVALDSSLANAAKLLVDLERLGLATRRVQVTEFQTRVLAEILRRTLIDLGHDLSDPEVRRVTTAHLDQAAAIEASLAATST